MSGSRAILLRLSVADADVVRTQLTQMGAAGEAALQRLDAAARATTGSGATGAVTRGGGGGSGFGGLRNSIGQAGFQLQDFVVQVQSGTSALTALGQQGSQFLGAFGAGGAIAGAVLVMGTLAAQFLTGSQAAEELRKVAEEGFKNTGKAAEELRDILKEINGLYGTQAEIAARATNATRDLLAERLRVQENNAHLFLEDSASAIGTATRDRDAAARNLARLEAQAARGGVTVQPGDIAAARGRLFEDEARLAGLRQDIERQQAALGRIAEGRARLANAGRVTGDGDEYGPPTPPGFGARRGSTGPDAITRMVRDNVMREHEREFAQAKRDMSLLGDETQRTRDITRDLGMTFTSAFEDAIVRGKSFRDVLAGIAEDIGRIVLRQTVTTPLAGALSSVVGNLFSPGGGSFSTGKFFGGGWLGGGGAKGAADAALAGAFSYGGARAAGGPVDPSSFYMVGERGPEWFVPNTSGSIVPNGAMGGTTLVMNINAQGAGPREIDALRMQIPAIARAAVEDAARRGGASARNIRGR